MNNTDITVPLHWQAWVWKGGDFPLALQRENITSQPVNAGQVLVRNAAIGLNPVDWKTLEMKTGQVPGVDGSGIVVAVSEDVDNTWLGQRVAYHQSLRQPGSFAEYTPVAARALMRLPARLDFAAAAAFPCPALTAWLALEKIPVHAGAEIAIAGAGGSVGHFLVQLAIARGFIVTTLCHPRHWNRLKALGVAHCLQALPATLPEETNQRYFALIDSVNADHAIALASMLRANGHLICIQGRAESWPNPPFGRALSLHEVALGALHYFGDDDDWRCLTAAGEQLLNQLTVSELQPETLLTFSFDSLPQQLAALKVRDFSGKHVILF